MDDSADAPAPPPARQHEPAADTRPGAGSPPAERPSAPPELRAAGAAGARRVEVAGSWNLRALAGLWRGLEGRLAQLASDPALHWDLSPLTALDDAGAVLLWRAWGGRRAAQLTAAPEYLALFDSLAAAPPSPPPVVRWRLTDPVVWLGSGAGLLVGHLLGFTALLGRMTLDTLHLARHPARLPWRELSASIYRTGAQALGVTGLVALLIGVVLSFLFSKELRTFGADTYIVNVLAISVLRELGPVLAAILVAGRSGSSMTAQFGVMRLTQELDALAVMGIPYSERLVIPKVLALTLALPLLVLWTDAIALLGGAFAAKMQLGIGIGYFVTHLPGAVPVSNLWLGVGKGAVFGFVIALIACHFGLRIKPNTQSLGLGTTNSVVTAITVVLLVDAVFAVVFSNVGVDV